MKKKFEENVASQIPETKSDEPLLPWKINESDMEKIESENQGYKDLSHDRPPLKTRPIFLALLIMAIFATALLIIASIATENGRIKIGISEKEKEAAALQVDLDKAAEEKKALENSASQLEKRVDDLSAQKKLFTAVFESLTKKPDDITPEAQPSQVPPVENKEAVSE